MNWRTNNALLEAFNVNNLNELTTETNTGTLTVAGTTTSQATNVTVNTLGAGLYADWTFAKDGFTVASGNNTFTAVAKDGYGRTDTNTITVNLPATSTFVYDLNGNLRTNGIQILDYDDENQLITNWVAGSWRSDFAYDGQHRRRIQRDYGWTGIAWILTNETRFIYDGKLILEERDANNLPRIALTRGPDLSGSLQGAGGIGGLLGVTENPVVNPAHNYYHSDGAGNVTCLINTSQLIVAKYLYGAFGNTLSISGAKALVNRYRFSSKPVHESSGTYDFMRRWYAPDLQRWLNRDPVAEDGGNNLFQFVSNNPSGIIDSIGLGTIVITGADGATTITTIPSQPKPTRPWRPAIPKTPPPSECKKKGPKDCWGSLPTDKLAKLPFLGPAKLGAAEGLKTGCVDCCGENFFQGGGEWNQCLADCEIKYLAMTGHGVSPNVPPGPQSP